MRQKKQKKRILYIEFNRDGTIGGSYFSLLFLIQSIDQCLFEPCAGFYSANDLEGEFRSSCAELYRFDRADDKPVRSPESKPSRIVSSAHDWGMLIARNIRFLKRNDIDLVHLNNNIKTGWDWMIASRILRIPVVTHHRGYFPKYRVGDRRVARGLLSGIICISYSIRDHLIENGIRNNKMVVVHNGLNPERFCPKRPRVDTMASLGLMEEDFRIGIIGNIRSWKGQDVVVRAVRLLKDKIPHLRCLIVGQAGYEDSDYFEGVLDLVEKGGLRRQIKLTGYRRDIPDIINCLEIVIHASRKPEPFGRIALEAMALSKPVIAVKGGGIQEIVAHGQTGLLIKPDDPEALAKAVERLYLNPSERVYFGRSGKRRLDELFSLNKNVAQTESLYRKVLGIG